MAVASWIHPLHVHLASIKALSDELASALSGDYAGDPYRVAAPTAPASYETLDTLSDALPLDGSYYYHGDDVRARRLPWVEVTLGTVSPLEDMLPEARSMGEHVLVDVQVRARVGLDVDDSNSLSATTARVRGQAGAQWLCNAAIKVILEHAPIKARAWDADDAFGIVNASGALMAEIDDNPPDAAEGQGTSVFDAVGAAQFRQVVQVPVSDPS